MSFHDIEFAKKSYLNVLWSIRRLNKASIHKTFNIEIWMYLFYFVPINDILHSLYYTENQSKVFNSILP